MSDIIKAAQERAAQIIAKAEKEAAIAALLPATLPSVPMIVIQQGPAWLSFNKVESIANILAIYDAFEHVQALDCKGTYRRVTWDGGFNEKQHGAILSDYGGWVDIDARCHEYLSGAQDASIRFFARLSDGSIVQVNCNLTQAHYSKAGFPMVLHTQFRNSSRSGRARSDWSYDWPAVARLADDYVSFGTGAPMPGMAHHGRAYFSDLRTFIESLQPKGV